MDFSAIDWRQPWLAHLRDLGCQLAASPDWKAAASRLAAERNLKNDAGHSIVFVPQEALPKSTGYEAHISKTGQVPSRDNLHDFFNALIWLHFPATKRTLNKLQAQEIDRQSSISLRGRQRDAATLFDENAALFISRDPTMTGLLKQRAWHSLLFSGASRFRSACEVIVFGHALIEKLIHPYKSITAHVWTMPAQAIDEEQSSGTSLASVDEALAKAIASGFISSDFCHLPILGVPGWWEGQDETFYADTSVFRPSSLHSADRAG
jgi:Protein of unknown function (DUF3025)